MSKLRLLFLFAIIFFISCEDQGLVVKCPDCLTEEPVHTDLDIKLVADFGNPVLVKVFEGNLEDSVLYRSVNVSVSSTTVSVTMNKKYTVTAMYHVGDNFFTAVDSATPRVRYEKDLCDNPCYFVYDRNINLRLKFTK